MNLSYEEAVDIIRDYIDNTFERYDVLDDSYNMEIVRCEMGIEDLARGYQKLLAFDPEEFVKDVDRPALWYSHACGLICDLYS